MRKNRKSINSSNTMKLSDSFCRSVFNSLNLNDSYWWCCVIFIVESAARQKRFIDMFNDAAQSGKRKSIFNLSYKKLISEVKRLSKSDIKACPKSQRICHYAKEILDETKNLPTWLTAGLIKYMIHRAKAENVSRLKAEMDLADDIDREFNLMQTHLKLKQDNKGDKSLERSNTLIRKRGEEWKDGNFVDDSPPDGPNLYVILTGFYDPELISELVQLEVPLLAILKVKNSYENIIFDEKSEQNSINHFWTTLNRNLADSNLSKLYCNFIFLNLCHPPMKEFLEDDEYDRISSDIYDRVSHVAFDLFDCYRQHVRYIRSMELRSFSDTRCETTNFLLYENKLSKVPNKLMSVPVILDALLNQVVENLTIFDNTNDEEEEQHFKDLYENVDLEPIFNNNKFYDELCSDIDKSIVTKFVDKLYDVCQKSDSMEDNTSKKELLPRTNGEKDILGRYGYTSLFKSLFDEKSFQNDEAYDGDFKCNCFEETFRLFLKTEHLSNDDAKHFLNFLALEDVISRIDESEFGKRTVIDNQSLLKSKLKKDDSIEITHYHNCLIKLVPSLKSEKLYKCTRSSKNSVRWVLHELNRIEYLCCSTFLEILNQCLLYYDQCRVTYLQATDCLILIFTNHGRNRSAKKRKCTASLRTPICLRDFVEYVIDEEKVWLENEQRKYEEEVFARILYYLNGSCQTDNQKASFQIQDFIFPSSLKSERLKAEDVGDKKIETQVSNDERNLNRKVDQSINKNTEIDTSFLPPRTFYVAECGSDEPLNFIGYNLGNCRLQVNYETQTFPSPDGTCVYVEIEEWLRSTKRISINVNIVEHNLWIHSTHDKDTDDTVSFHLTTRSGTVVAFMSVSDAGLSDDVNCQKSFKCYIGETSGLVIEPRVNNTNKIHCIIESNINPKEVNNEIKRKIMPNGTVIIYFVDGLIRLLFANGTIVDLKSYPKINNDIKTSVFDDNISLLGDKDKKSNKRKESRTSLKLNRRKISRSLIDEILSAEQDLSVEASSSNIESASQIEKLHYIVLEHDGRWYEVLGDDIIQEFDRLLVRTVCNYEVDENFTSREDGMNILQKSYGDCIVSFADGTRITSGFIIEDEPVVCDWTDEELELYFLRNQRHGLSTKNNSKQRRMIARNNLREEMKELLTADSFVSILLTCRVEHRNYASVEFDTSKSQCILRMLDDIKVGIMPDGCYNVCMGLDARLKVSPKSVELTKLICQKCNGKSESMYKCNIFSGDENDPIIFQNTDLFGNTVKVHKSGITDHKCVTSCKCKDSKNHRCIDYGNPKNCERAMKKCLPAVSTKHDRFRIFAMNRDFTAFEYLHQSAIREVKKDVTPDMSFTLIHYPGAGLLDSRYQSAQASLDKRIKLAQCFQESKNKMSLRSSYSIPYDWLFPSDKYGDGYQKHAFNSALREHSKKALNTFQTGRHIKNIDNNALIRLSKTVGSCWKYFTYVDTP